MGGLGLGTSISNETSRANPSEQLLSSSERGSVSIRSEECASGEEAEMSGEQSPCSLATLTCNNVMLLAGLRRLAS